MTLLQRLRNTIFWDKPIEQQLTSLSQFDNITDKEIQELADTCYKSTEAGILIEYLGFAKLKPYLPSFLEFVQDMNWPAAGGASRMLIKSGIDIIPEIRRVFHEVKNDEMWHYWILTNIVQYFNHNLIALLKPDLLMLLQKADTEGVAIQALRILKENQLLTKAEIEEHYHFLLQEYEGDECWTNDLKEEVKSE